MQRAKQWEADAIIGRWPDEKMSLLDSVDIPVVLQNNGSRSDVFSNLTGDYDSTGKMAFYTGCLDLRIKVVLASDFGFLWEQSNWDQPWYWGIKLERLKSAGITNTNILSNAEGKPFMLIAGYYDNDKSYDAMLQAASYADCQENLVLVNHGTGHRPTWESLEAGYDFLDKHLKQ